MSGELAEVGAVELSHSSCGKHAMHWTVVRQGRSRIRTTRDTDLALEVRCNTCFVMRIEIRSSPNRNRIRSCDTSVFGGANVISFGLLVH